MGLVIDAHTLGDLEIFDSGTDDPSLFDFCNGTRSDGGARALRRRMEQPWSSADDILGTQAAIRFILVHRQVFEELPSSYLMNRADHYRQEVLPMIEAKGSLEFGLTALSLWANQRSHYTSMLLGVQVTQRFIRILRSVLRELTPLNPQGELKKMVADMNALLERDAIKGVPDQEAKRLWKVLRLDQLFRLYEKNTIVQLQQLVFEMDALIAMADVTCDKGYSLPELLSGPMAVDAEGLTHPFLDEPVANSVHLDQERRVMFITGPNMAGKTTYLRAVATAFFLAHLGMGVPATNFRFVPAERLTTSINLADDLRAGISYFRAEALRVKSIAEAIGTGEKVFALMDEPFKGTNVKDALDASLAILFRFSKREDCLFMFSSHLIELHEQLTDTASIDCRFFEADDTGEKLRFDYKLKAGVSSQRLGMRVLAQEGVFDLLDKNS
ncbi:MAG: hypothetical protein JJ957_07705 [Pseudomonadales bacterium]|nr:hypothetical protein [Pseudomonadales bacterium]MBO6595713.1 hypothetical protein [Pseudomonadales bacterium]MBO6820729.1 hypothetical protein [Pseudomonadales bacterium]